MDEPAKGDSGPGDGLEEDDLWPLPTPNPTSKLFFAVAIVASSLTSWKLFSRSPSTCCCTGFPTVLPFPSTRSRWVWRIFASVGMHARVDLMQINAEIPLLAARAFEAFDFPLAWVGIDGPCDFLDAAAESDVWLPEGLSAKVRLPSLSAATSPNSCLRFFRSCSERFCIIAGTTTMFVSILSRPERFFNCCNVA